MSALGKQRNCQQAQSFPNQPANSRRRRIKASNMSDSKGCGVHSGRIDGNWTWVPARLAQASGRVRRSNRPNVQTSCQRTMPVCCLTRPVTDHREQRASRGKQPTGCGTALATAPSQSRLFATPESNPKFVRPAVPRSVDVPSAPITQGPGCCCARSQHVCRRSAISQQISGSRTKGLLCACGPQIRANPAIHSGQACC